jgi:TetR/AcrR family transcriptional regulator, transcriptional repressor of bet genes
MPRPSNKEERRIQIAAALMKVMADRGYDGAAISDIAAAACLTPGLVHYHFKNKQEILLVALRSIVAEHDAKLEERLGQGKGDPVAQVAAFIDFHLSVGADANPEMLACWILTSGEALRQPEVQVEYERAIAGTIKCLEGIIRRGVNQGVFRCKAIDVAACALVAAIQGYFVLGAAARSTVPRGSAANSTKRMADGLLHPIRPISKRRGRP